MDGQIKQIYDYVSKMEEKHEGLLTCGENYIADQVNLSAMTAYGSIRWFIEDLLSKQENQYKTTVL